jgi:protein gp37
MLVDIDKAFGIMAQCPEHTFLVLTKRSYRLERAMKDVDDALQDLRRDNVWVGTTVCNQTEANAKIPELLKVPGHKWLSIEPCLGPVDLSEVFGIYEYDDDKWSTKVGSRWKDSPDWVVVGAETGPHRRPCSAHWIRTIVLQCEAAGVPVWVKAVDLGKKVSHDMNEWPEDLRAREVPWEERT